MYRILIISLFFISSLLAQNKVYVGRIEGTIDLGLAPYIKRLIQEAEEDKARAVIFYINTFGGRVDAATQIKDAILNSKVNTTAFIDKRAISAGALIALSCQKIVMAPGGLIGASTVVDQGGKKVSEKYQSFMRSEMRSTAEKNGRRKDIAEGMVDESIVIEGLVDSTKLITLTTNEALEYGIADTMLSSLDDVVKYLNISDAEIIEIESNWAEDFVRFVNNPIISSLLIMIGLVGLFTEVKTPGWGIPGSAAVIALTIFFGASYILELASFIEIIIFVLGVVLLLVEIFVIPGFGLFGIIGIIMIIAGLFLGLISDLPVFDFSFISAALIQLASALLLSGLFILSLSKVLPKTGMWNRMILQTGIDSKSGYSSFPGIQHLTGKKGKAISDLRPSGIAMIDGKRIDVVTEGDYIEAGQKIIVYSIEGSKVVVKRI